MKRLFNNKKNILLALVVAFSLFSKIAFAVWNGDFYNPGDTLNPECLPTDTNCNVLPPLTSLVGAVLLDQTSAQTIGDTVHRLAKLWATDINTTDLTVANPITGSVTGNAGTVTNGVYTTDADTVYLTPGTAAATYQPVGAYLTDISGQDLSTADNSTSQFTTLAAVAGVGYLTSETDPIFSASDAANITSTDITHLGNLSGTNSGDNSANSTYASDYRVGNFVAGTNYEVPLTFSTGLTRTTNTITNNLSTGVSGGQSVIGGTAANNVLTIEGNNSSSGNTSTNANLSFKVGDSAGTTAMTILNNGNIGIGTTNPGGYNLLINPATGDASYGVQRSNNANQAYVSILPTGANTTSNVTWAYGMHASSNDFNIFAWNGSTNNDYLTIKNDGKVGIGTTTPGGKLQIGNGADLSNTSGYLILTNSAYTSTISSAFGAGNSSNLVLSAAGGVQFSSPSSNNVGTGISSFGNDGIYFPGVASSDINIQFRNNWGYDQAEPSLNIKGAGQYAASVTNLLGGNVTMTGGAGASGSAGLANGGNVLINGGVGYGTGHNGYILLGTTNAGNVGIGTTSPTGLLTVAGSNTSGVTDILVNPGTKTSGNLVDLQINGTSKFKVDNSGNITSNNYSVSSGAGIYGGGIANNSERVIWANRNNLSDVGWGTGSGFYFSSSISGNAIDNGITRLSAGKIGVGNGTNGDVSGTLIAGNVGIGTTSPTANLQVAQGTSGAGTVAVSGTAVTGTNTQFTNTFKVGDSITVTTTSGSETKAIATITDDTHLVTAAFTGTAASGTAYTLTGGTRFSVLGNGNVGIGTATPGYALDVNGNIGNSNGALGFYSGGTNQNITFTPSGTGIVSFVTNPNSNGVTGVSFVNNYATGTNYAVPMAMYAPNITAGARVQSIMGVAQATNNDVGTTFSYAGSGSASNRYGWNFYGGNEILSLLAGGNVGIGNETSPSSKLSVKGNASVGSSYSEIAAPADGLIIQGNVGIGTSSPTNILSLGNAAAQKFWIENSATDVVGRALTVAAGGTVAGTSVSNVVGGQLILQSGLGTGTGDSSIAFQTGTTLSSGMTLQTMSTKMTILGSGNVGIGIAAPGSLLTVGSSSQFTVSSAGAISANSTAAFNNSFEFFNGSSSFFRGSIYMTNGGVTTASAVSALDNSGNFTTASTGKLLWSSLGTPVAGSGDTGITRDSAGVLDIGTGGAGSKAGSLNFTNFNASGTSPTLSDSSYTTCSALTTVSNVITCTASDATLKTNFNAYNDGLDFIRKIQPTTYTFKEGTAYFDNNRERLGLIAQEVQATGLTDAVLPIGNGLLQVDFNAVTAATISAVKALDLNLTAIAGTTDPISGSDNESFVTAFFNNVETKLGSWLADVGNGLTDVVAGTFKAKDQLCINDTCVTEAQLQALIEMQNNSNQIQPPASTPPAGTPQEGNNTPPPVVTPPAPDPTPDVTPAPTPDPAPEPTVTPDPNINSDPAPTPDPAPAADAPVAPTL